LNTLIALRQEHVALHDPGVVERPVLDDDPVELRLPVLPPFGLSRENRGDRDATRT
jgi:hypothetical protein